MWEEQLKRKCPSELSTRVLGMEEIKTVFEGVSDFRTGALTSKACSHPHFPFENLGDQS